MYVIYGVTDTGIKIPGMSKVALTKLGAEYKLKKLNKLRPDNGFWGWAYERTM